MNRPASRARVLLIHPGALGDLIQARAAFATVRASFPGASLALLTGTSGAQLARSFALFDDVLTFDDRAAYRGAPVARLRALVTAIVRARGFAPERVGVFKAALPYAVIARASGARVRVGITRGPGARLLTQPVELRAGDHWDARYLAVAAALAPPGMPTQPVAEWPIDVLPPALDAEISARPRRATLLVAIAPGGARNIKGEMPQKRWPTARYAAVAQRVQQQYADVAFVVLGAASDRADADELIAGLPSAPVVDLVARTSLTEARAAIARADVFVGNDSSLLHVAASTDTPTVAIFGPTDPRAIAPRGTHVRWVWSPARGVPCHDEISGTLRDCTGACCIERVTVDAVFDAVTAALGTRAPTLQSTA